MKQRRPLFPNILPAWLVIIATGINSAAPSSAYLWIVLGGITISLIGTLACAISFPTDTVTLMYNRLHNWFEITFGEMFAATGINLRFSTRQN
jgi:threonine/homoserine/homoserine lactone efflux protein